MVQAASKLHLRRTLPVVIVGQGLNAVLSLIFILLVSRWLGPDGKGVHAVLASAAQIGAVILGFGYAGAIPFAVRGDPGRLPAVTWVQGKLIALTVVAMVALAVLDRWSGIWPALRGAELPLALLTLGWITQQFATSLALSVGDAHASVGASLVGTGLGLLALGGIRISDGAFTPAMAVGVQGAGLILGAVWAAGRVLRDARRARADRTPLADAPGNAVAKASMLGLASSIAATLMVRGDVFLVEAYAGTAVAGVYSLAAYLVEIGTKVPQWSASALTSAVAADHHAGIDRTLGLTLGAIVAALCFFLGVLLFEPLLDRGLLAFVGRGFAATLPLFLALAPRVVLQAGLALLAGNLAAHGYTRWHTGGTVLGLVTMVLVDLASIPRWGGMGAALGGFLGIAATAVVMLIGFVRLNRVTWGSVAARSVGAFVGQSRAAGRAIRQRFT